MTIGDASADEGDAITFTVSLDNAVDGGFTVTPQYQSGTTSNDDFTPNTTPITFTGTAGESHTFTVQTTEDTLGEGWEYFEVRPVVSGSSIPRSHLAGVGVARGTIHDDDETQTIIRILNADALEGDQIEFTVYSNDYLLPPDCGTVKIVPSYTNGTAESADYTENTTQLTFQGGANETQTFRVSTAEDAVREGDETFQVLLTHDDSTLEPECQNLDYVAVGPAATGTILEDDFETVSLSLSSASIAESGGSATVTASLDRASPAATTVAVTATPVAPAVAGDFTVSSNTTLTIAQGQTSSTGTVRIRAVDNRVDAADRQVTVSGVATNSATVYGPSDVTLTLTDDDTAGVTLSRTALAVVEGGAGRTYTVVLDTKPTADVSIALAVTGDDDVSVSPASLVFDERTWRTRQTVTVSAASDADWTAGTAAIQHTASSADAVYNAVTISNVLATEVDTTYGLVVSPERVEVPEGGTVDYTVALKARPTRNVTVRLSRSGDSDVRLGTTRLTFTTSSFSTAQTVTLTGREDNDNASGTATIRHRTSSSDSNYASYRNHVVDLTATEVDNEPGVFVSRTAVDVAEGGGGSWTVALQAQPAHSVTIAVARRSGDTDLTGGSTLVFTTTSWSAAQTVAVSAAEDDDGLDGTAVFGHTVTSTDAGYDGFAVADVTATEADNDRA